MPQILREKTIVYQSLDENTLDSFSQKKRKFFAMKISDLSSVILYDMHKYWSSPLSTVNFVLWICEKFQQHLYQSKYSSIWYTKFSLMYNLFYTGTITIFVVIFSRKININPDNVAAPIAASLGDVVTLALLSYISRFIFQKSGTYVAWLPYI